MEQIQHPQYLRKMDNFHSSRSNNPLQIYGPSQLQMVVTPATKVKHIT